MLDCTGTEVTTRRDVLGDVEAAYRVNFVLYVRRYANDNQFREKAAEFLSHFVHWINEERIFGTAPTFGDVDTDKEIIKASGGMKWQAVDEQGTVVDYMWQVQLNYKLLYID
jgi:hypothetical protein